MTNKIVITSGEPAGIGPDICLNLLSHDYANLKNTEIYIIADVNLFIDRAKILNIPLEYQLHDDMNNLSQSYQKNKLNSQYVLKMLNRKSMQWLPARYKKASSMKQAYYLLGTPNILLIDLKRHLS